MESKEDGVLSFAIDDFPIMTDESIEEFWIRKVERHRELRNQIFSKLEAEVAKESML